MRPKTVLSWALLPLLLLPLPAPAEGDVDGPESPEAPESGEGPEGVLVGMPDPSIIALPDRSPRSSRYVIFATGAGLPFYSSRDLVHWRPAGRVFEEAVPPWAARSVPGTRGIWAPHVERIGGLYHLYYSCSTFGKQRSVIGLAVNRSLNPGSSEYRWEDRGEVIASQPGDSFNAIDPATFVDRDGRVYLFWGSYWSGLKAIQLDPKSGKPLRGAKRVDIADRRQPPNAIEAPYIVAHGGRYYLFVSFDSCCDGAKSTYKVMVGGADSVLGPYLDAAGRPLMEGGGTLVVASDERWRGPGHNSVLQERSRDWLVHHTYDMEHLDHHRILQIRPLYWLQDGWPVAGEPLVLTHEKPRQAITARGLVGRWESSVDYDSDSSRTIELQEGGTIRDSDGSSWSLQENRLTLRWKNERAPGGYWVDEVIVEPSGASYIGRNQSHAVIRGRRVD